jgi:hypothetical protein
MPESHLIEQSCCKWFYAPLVMASLSNSKRKKKLADLQFTQHRLFELSIDPS